VSTPDSQASSPRASSTLCLDDAAYVLGILPPAERQAFEQHLSDCPACQASVARLAGLPGLLALTSAAELETDPPPLPETLLPKLLTAAARERRRRRLVWIGTVAAAAACVVALVLILVVRPDSAAKSVALPNPIPMTSLVPGPMAVSLQLVDKQWGTSVVITCHYSGSHDAGEDYQLVAFDSGGKAQNLGWWMSVAGGGSTVTTASSLRLGDISRLEVQLANGTPLLSAVPPHG
jgi:anti-sigma-K factor RskA